MKKLYEVVTVETKGDDEHSRMVDMICNAEYAYNTVEF